MSLSTPEQGNLPRQLKLTSGFGRNHPGPGNVAAQFVAAGLIDEMIVAFRAVYAR
ncbi:MAG: hypothetical protein K0U76_04965 [Actinomycetia bacterium]|nr:hypothetical protein [Actinomycetes bacterium]MCH9700725.1 hypothetical protein [Actinomycetes bacterium]MCH9762137.1 hypothetical protein [Actinomycetes bacterium]